MVNGRITAEQMDWLQARADQLAGNLSAALRQTITDARLLELAREDYKQMREEHPDFAMPRVWPDGPNRLVEGVLGLELIDVDDRKLREAEERDS